MPTYDEIIRSLKQRKPQRVYLLAGDEPLFIDQIASFAAKELIPAEEQDFNQSILYGAEVNARTILLEALRFPMMGSQVLVLVREAQQVRDLDTLAAHLDELPESTCLILCYKKKADKRKALYKAISERGGFFESTKMYDSKIPDFIIKSFAARQLDIDPRTAHLMADSTGNDLEKILNEVEKIALALSEKGTRTVTPEVIEYYIGVSKEYNNFELLTALIRRDAARAYRIAQPSHPDDALHALRLLLEPHGGLLHRPAQRAEHRLPPRGTALRRPRLRPGTSRLLGRTDLRHHPPDTPHRRLLEGGRCQHPYEPALL